MSARALSRVLLSLTAIASLSHVAGAQCPPVPAATVPDPTLAGAPSPPAQTTAMRRTDVQKQDASYCLYSPPHAEAQGLVLYAHGGQVAEVGALDPMLQFLAQSGFYVVYPYIPNLLAAWQYPKHAHDALRDALDNLLARQIPIRSVAVAGHSLGAMAAVRAAALWHHGIPVRAIVLHEPAGLIVFPASADWVTQDALKPIRCATHLLIVQAQSSVGDTNSAALTIWERLPQVSRFVSTTTQRSRRNFLRIPDDTSHAVARSSHHLVVNAPPTSMAYFGYWRPLLVGLLEAARDEKALEDGYTPYCNRSGTGGGVCGHWGTGDMGRWHDDVPATRMQNAADLHLFDNMPIPAACPLPVIVVDPPKDR